MSLTPFQSEGLHVLGYTRREGEFLFLVATHSGYFTSHQFKPFADTESGSNAFIHKLLDRKHANFHVYRSGGRVYHLIARKLYQAMERTNLLVHKTRQLDYLKTRLIALDFILGHPQHHYLEMELDKIGYFKTEYNIGPETLPVKQYLSPKSSELRRRHFVERFPMFVNSLPPSPVVTFTYVDAGAVTLDGFETHLRAYLRLFQALPRFEFIYISPTPRMFRAAESVFYRVLHGRRQPHKSVAILDYFRLRKSWDSRKRVASADVILLEEAHQYYVGAQTEELYEQWRQGVLADDDVTRNTSPSGARVNGAFGTLVCGSSLTVFGDPAGSGTERGVEGNDPQDIGARSAKPSVEALKS
jgi:hypothetical protein